MRSHFAVLALVPGLLLLAACGNEPPTPGEIEVTSDPAGAAIYLDGAPTGEVTPHVLTGIEGGRYVVSVSLEDWTSVTGELQVSVQYGGRATADFTLSQNVGLLTVTSTPSAAAILLDGDDTGQVTPHTFDNLIEGDYQVAVDLDDHIAESGARTVSVATGEESSVDFVLLDTRLPRTVLMEGFSNVYCSGCATMAANMEFVMAEPGYGPDRLLYVKWPAYLNGLDPFHTQAAAVVDPRVAYYYPGGNTSLPALAGDGVVGQSFSSEGIRNYVDGQPEIAYVDVAVTTAEDLTDVDDLVHEATVTVRTVGGIDLAGHALYVALVYDEVESAEDYPFGNGTEHHWVLRDFVEAVDDLGVLEPQEAIDAPVTLTDPLAPPVIPGHDIYPHGKQIIAFVQNVATKAILQAGSTLTATSTLSRPDGSPPAPRHATPGGMR